MPPKPAAASDAAKTAKKRADAGAAQAKPKSPEQVLTEKLELDRFVEGLRRKFH